MSAALAIAVAVAAQLQPLPPNLIPLDSDAGRQMLVESGASRDFFALVPRFATQPSTAYCGVTSAVMVLNALAVAAPEVPAWAPFRAFTEDNVFAAASGVTPAAVAGRGATIADLTRLLDANGAEARAVFADASSADELRAQASAALADDTSFVLVDFLRGELGQDTGAHWSPLAAYHAPSDRFLVLDVARFRYPPYWVTTADLYRAMDTRDLDSGQARGWLLVRRAAGAPGRIAIPPMKHRLFLFAVLAGSVVFLVGALTGGLVVYLRMRRRTLIAVALLALGLAPAAARASDKGLWFDFPPYPGARLLCTEVVVGSKGEHITWRTLASRDAPAHVTAFFEKSEQATAEKRDDGSRAIAAHADPTRVKMSIYPVTLIDKFPHCTEGAAKGEKTVILVSQML